MFLFEGVEDKYMESVLDGADTVLVFEAGVPKSMEFLLIPRLGIFSDRWIIFIDVGIVLVKRSRYPWLIL